MEFSEAIASVMALVSAVITVVLVPYIKSKTSDMQQAEFVKWVKIAVAAAEQIFKEAGLGNKKREYVLGWLEKNGYKLDDAQVLGEIELLIEATVSEINSGVAKSTR